MFDSNVYIVKIYKNQKKDTVIFNLAQKKIANNKKINYKLNKHNSLPTQVFDKWFSLDEQTDVIRAKTNEIDNEKFIEILLAIDVFDEDSDLIETIRCKIEINETIKNRRVENKTQWLFFKPDMIK